MAEAVAVNASGGIPPIPQGAQVRERGSAPVAAQPDAAPQPAQPTFDPALFQQQPAQPAPQAQPAADPSLLALLSALSNSNAPAQPQVAPAPSQPAQAPVAGGDPVQNSFTSILTSAGVDVKAAIGLAVEYGDPRLINKEALAKAGPQAAQMEQIATALIQHRIATEARVEQEVFVKFGGEANFDAAIGHFAKTAPVILRDFVKGALDSGDPAKMHQAADFVRQYVTGSGVTVNPAGLVQSGAAGAYGAGAPLDKEAFKAELMKLDHRAPDYDQQRNQLFYRRQQGKNLGRN